MSRNPVRLLFVLNDPRFFLTHRLGLARAARDAGYEVTVAVPDEPGVAEIREQGFPVETIPLQRQGTNPIADVRAILALWLLYRRLGPQIVHHVTVKPVLYGTIAARVANVPGVVNAIAGLGTLFAENGAVSQLRSAAMRMFYRMALRHRNAIVIFQNEADRELFVRAGISTLGQTVLVPGSGVDVEAFSVSPEPEGIPTVVLTARLLRQKGISEFVEASRRLRSEGVQARFVLVGDGAGNRDAVDQAELDQWRNEGVVELWGWQEDMPRVMQQTTIACLPSYYREGVPKALLDAAAAGRPIVTTDMPGCRDVVQHGVNGLLVPPRDATALASALRTLLTDAAARARFGAAGREIAVRHFNLQTVKATTLQVYGRLLQHNPDSSWAD